MTRMAEQLPIPVPCMPRRHLCMLLLMLPPVCIWALAEVTTVVVGVAVAVAAGVTERAGAAFPVSKNASAGRIFNGDIYFIGENHFKW